MLDRSPVLDGLAAEDRELLERLLDTEVGRVLRDDAKPYVLSRWRRTPRQVFAELTSGSARIRVGMEGRRVIVVDSALRVAKDKRDDEHARTKLDLIASALREALHDAQDLWAEIGEAESASRWSIPVRSLLERVEDAIGPLLPDVEDAASELPHD